MGKYIATASVEFAHDCVKAAILEIPQYRTLLRGPWKSVAIGLTTDEKTFDLRSLSMTFRSRSGTKADVEGCVIGHLGEWDRARLTIRVPSDPSSWKIEGKLNSEGNFEFDTPRKIY
ncbi:MAG: hypothetical protein JWN75_639 [Candidatus Saccharibacteria bacterium]|nr:hypothetical protein [Candidatus Saccharibacteria bacterium]